jgi:hypothetical protein
LTDPAYAYGVAVGRRCGDGSYPDAAAGTWLVVDYNRLAKAAG